VVVTVQGEWVRVAVADSGSGVPPEYRSDLFRRFVHPQSGNHKAQMGVGLGLSVVKAIVDAHGGQVGIGDRKGGGAQFWFTLPLAEET
jgi:K+-sensing histidine kinase KdpD